MDTKLTVAVSITRENFIMEHFMDSDDIFALVKSGCFYVESPDGNFTVKANEGMLFRKNTRYHRRIIEPARMFLFRYTSERAVFDCEHVLFKDQKRLLSTMNMFETIDTKIHMDEFKYKRHLFEDIILQYITENEIAHYSDICIEKSIEEIKNTFHSKRSLTEIASATGLSYIQFFRRFKAVTGLSPSDYVIALRLNKAKDLLINTTLQINQISTICGFENEYYFSNFFKKHTTLSPTAFRSSLS